MQKFIAENLRYPAESLNNGSQGKTVLRFVVERDVSITNVEVLKYSGDPLLDKEAIRVASVMPKWNPAYEDGTPIRTYYSLPITFKLSSETQEGGQRQKAVVQVKEENVVEKETEDKENVLIHETMPEFPGGMQAMQKFIAENLQYPKISRENGSTGKTVVCFAVEKDGSISDVEVVTSSGDDYLDAEATRVVKAMPKWSPGKLNETPVRVKFTIPINFNLN